MDKYYYLICQLPFLVFGEVTYINRDNFLEEAEKWTGREDFLILSQVDINDFSLDGNYPGVLREYKEFESNLRNELSLLRYLNKRSPEKAEHKYKGSGFLTPLIKEGNPLEVEKRLIHLRWKFIEEKEQNHYFDLESLILYYLKLQILERLLTFNKDKGFEKFKELCEVTL